MTRIACTHAGRRLAAAALTLALAAPLAPATAQTQSPAQPRKLTREISVMEKIIDQMLLDSPNLLVYSHENNTRGLYLDEFGVLFSFQASLVDRRGGMPFALRDLPFTDLKVEDKDGQKVIVLPRDRGKKKAKADEEAAADSAEAIYERVLRGKGRESQAKLYEKGKVEIIDLLLDYGDTMNSLRDNQWLAVAAFLKGSDYFLDNKISRLVLKARMTDLRAFAAGRLTREAMLAKVVQEEY